MSTVAGGEAELYDSRMNAIDIFRAVRGLPDWTQAAQRAVPSRTAAGVAYRGLSDEDMLACQLALDEKDRKLERIRALETVLNRSRNG